MSLLLLDLLLFTSKVIVIGLFIVILFVVLLAISARLKEKLQSHIQITHLNEQHNESKYELLAMILDKKAFKKFMKEEKKNQKALEAEKEKRTRVYHFHYEGDIHASANKALTKLVNVIVSIAKPNDEVVVSIESGGGVVHGYGLAAAELMRFRKNNIQLTVCIDKVAASGGYMMAAIANKIIAAPFSIIGSIGVVMQLPNFNRWLKDRHIDFELQTAGAYKRTLTMFGENTDEAREKVKKELDVMHGSFKALIEEHRPQVDLNRAATGEHWLAKQALELKLVDELDTLNAYLTRRMQEAEVYQLRVFSKKSLMEKLSGQVRAMWESVLKLASSSH